MKKDLERLIHVVTNSMSTILLFTIWQQKKIPVIGSTRQTAAYKRQHLRHLLLTMPLSNEK